jgi:hypothetical protein
MRSSRGCVLNRISLVPGLGGIAYLTGCILTGMNIFVAFFVLLLLLADSTPPAASSIPLIGMPLRDSKLFCLTYSHLSATETRTHQRKVFIHHCLPPRYVGMNIFVAFFLLLLLLADSTPPAASSVPLIGMSGASMSNRIYARLYFSRFSRLST